MSYAHQSNAALAGLFGGGIAAQNAAQQSNITQSYAQAAAQAQNYTSQSPTALAQAYQSQSIGAMVQQGQQNATTSMELEHEAYETPVAMLIDLWVTRFGNEWVDLETIDNDEFFSKACKRLKQMGQLEMHYLTDRARYVCRKPK